MRVFAILRPNRDATQGMKIVLRIFVVLNLLLAGAALFFGHVLWMQREELKARVALLEEYTAKISTQIERDQAADLVELEIEKVNIS